jgi:anti-sigma factor RsiW
MEYWNDGRVKEWNDGMMECWNVGRMEEKRVQVASKKLRTKLKGKS